MKLSEKMAYLQGLTAGLDIDDSTKEGKVLLELSKIVSELVTYVDGLQQEVSDIAELCNDLDYDLGELEEALYDLDDDDCDCGHIHSHAHDFEDEENDEDDDFSHDELDRFLNEIFDDDENDNVKIEGPVYEVKCPKCGNELLLDKEEIQKGSIKCPECAELLEFDFEGK